MKTSFLCVLAVEFAVSSSAFAAAGAGFNRLEIHGRFVAEGAAIGDFNGDGTMDMVAGPDWFEGPDFKAEHTFRDVVTTSPRDWSAESRSFDPENYSDDFLTFAYDFNNDGWTDILVINWPGEDASWFENPRGESRLGLWPKHLAFPSVNTESPNFLDITGDGRPEIVAGTGRQLGYMSFDPANPAAEWTFHAVTPEGRYPRYTHGIGAGDVNGDGRMDFLEANGWWEQPASLDGDPVWTFHEHRFAGNQGGAQMYAYDVNGDGLNDVITSLNAHRYGFSWYEQGRDTSGAATWTEHAIMSLDADTKINGVQFSQPHAVEIVDMDGDGLKDIVTGKRYLAHGSTGDVDPLGTPVVYWFKLERGADGSASFTPHLIDDDSGVGTQFSVGDLNGDGRPDLAISNKKGAFVLRQTR